MDPQPPFPPFTAATLARRFPDDVALQGRLLLLRRWLVDDEPASALTGSGIAQRTLYRLRTIWEEQGLAGLVTARARGTPPAIDGALVRSLLTTLRNEGAFALGCAPRSALTPQHADPLLAGRCLAWQLQRLVAAADAEIAAAHRIPQLLQRRLLNNEASEAIADAAGLTVRSIQRLLAAGLGCIAAALPGALAAATAPAPWDGSVAPALHGRDELLGCLTAELRSHAAVQLVGLSGMGKSTVAATTAASWEAAGWYVAWVRCADSSDPAAATLASLQGQLFDLGLLGGQSVDPFRPPAERLQSLRRRLRDVPLVLILDDAQAGQVQPGWSALLAELCALGSSVHALVVGQRPLVEGVPQLTLDGLPSVAARALYSARHGAVSDADWQHIYAQTRGNPKLIELVDPAQPAALQAEVAGMLKESIWALEPELRQALLWLSWSNPAAPEHAALTAAAQAAPWVWQGLARRGLVSLHAGQVTIHDLVREHLRQVAPAHEWAAVRRRVSAYATTAALWPLVFRCAADSGDAAAQSAASAAAARQAEGLGEPAVAGEWWATAAQLAATQADIAAVISARLLQAECALQLLDGAATLAVLAELPDGADPAQRWWAALYRFEAQRVNGDYAAAAAVLAAPPLAGAVPPGVSAVGAWRLALGRVWLAFSEERDHEAWALYQQLGPPPAGVRLHMQLRYYRVGAHLAHSHHQYARCRQLSKRQVTLARRSRSAFCIAESQLSYIYALYACEDYAAAYAKLAALQPTLHEEWTALERQAAAYGAVLAYYLGKLGAAQQHAATAMRASTALGWQDDDEFVFWVAGLVASGLGDAAGALAAFARASDPAQATVRTLWAAITAVRSDDVEAAAPLFTTLLQSTLRTRARPWLVDLRAPWAEFQQLRGQTVAARRHFQRAATAHGAAGLVVSQALALAGLSDSLVRAGQPRAALAASAAAVACLDGQPLGLIIAPQVWAARAEALQAAGEFRRGGLGKRPPQPALPAAPAAAHRRPRSLSGPAPPPRACGPVRPRPPAQSAPRARSRRRLTVAVPRIHIDTARHSR